MMNLKQIARHLACPNTESLDVHGVTIDSRTLQPGDLFVAISGEQFDGHDFISEAAQKGAIAVICEHPCRHVTIPQLVVPSTLDALAQLAVCHRQTMTNPVIAVTGSNGKTSVKEMIYCILPKPAHKTPGNLNNHLGVPLSLLKFQASDRYAVFELGANHVGEIATTVNLVKPQVTLINNIAPAHIEGFGSIEGVARAKGEIYQGLATGGTAVVNDDDDFAHFWDDFLVDKKVLRFSARHPSDIHALAIEFNEQGCASFTLVLPVGEALIQLQVPGEHAVRNALAAAACCFAVGIELHDIAKGLREFQGVEGRMTFLHGKNQALIIDDTYNANLRSVLAAVEVLAKRQGQRILVLGDLGELGDFTQGHHEEIGRVARAKGINRLMTCGKQSEFSTTAFGSAAKHYPNQQKLAQDLLTCLDKNTTVLIKGSRSAAMEKVVQELVE